ncbi:hypothetical protein V8C86DRAFT_2736845 [Haematococcus lacustris]
MGMLCCFGRNECKPAEREGPLRPPTFPQRRPRTDAPIEVAQCVEPACSHGPHEVTSMLHLLAEQKGLPIEAIQGAAELLAHRLGAQYASISVLCEGPNGVCGVSVAAAGELAVLVQQGLPINLEDEDEAEDSSTSLRAVMDTKAPLLCLPNPGCSQPRYPNPLPYDWRLLQLQSGLASFVAVPIVRGGRLLGALTVATLSSHAWHESCSSLLTCLEAAAIWVSQWLAVGELLRLGQLHAEVWAAADVEGLVRALCQGLAEHCRARLQLKLNVR